MDQIFDLLVLGGGPAGYPAAIRASQLGASVCLIEKESIGGVCLNRGCIPTKTMHALAHLIESSSGGDGKGVAGSIKADATGLFLHKDDVVESLVSGVEKLLSGRKIDVVKGSGRITSPGEIEVEGTGTVKGRKILIATGSTEIEIPGLEFNGKNILSSTDLLDLGRIPESMLVIGGGVIGCEFASIFSAFGTRVTVVEMLPSLIATEDIHIIRFFQSIMKKKGITLRLGSMVRELVSDGGKVTARLVSDEELSAEVALVSVGRSPNISGIGLGALGIKTDKKGIKVNNRMECTAEGFYAAGDVAGGWLLAHVATREGIVAAENALGSSREINFDSVPFTIYTLPEISRVGLTEAEAKAHGFEIAAGRFPFAANGKARGLREEDGFVKWVASREDGRLLGLHIIGPQATELISFGTLAIEKKMKVEDIASVIFPHPTLCEAIGEAAEAVEGKAIHLLR
ncbi:MAG: dihydrolipoyl dehydrogenase [Candidatus Krumholzibacteriota bacterium]|nr:dihydrolipoyl dehydrogenase [Candidatus Krumholzibacteriota bacterium]